MTSYPPPTGQTPPPEFGAAPQQPYGAPAPPPQQPYGAPVPPQQAYGAPAPPPYVPVETQAVKAPVVAWLVPIAALLAVIGVFTPWFKAKATASANGETAHHTFDGLYPEGECRVTTGAGGSVQADLAGVNLDVDLLIKALERLASPGSLVGQVDVSSFAGEAPERYARFVFESGRTSIQRPVLWHSDT